MNENIIFRLAIIAIIAYVVFPVFKAIFNLLCRKFSHEKTFKAQVIKKFRHEYVKHIKRGSHSRNMATDHYVIFGTEDGRRKKLLTNERLYNCISSDDKGVVTHKWRDLIEFSPDELQK